MIADLLNRPKDMTQLSSFSFPNANHHDLVVAVLRAQGNANVNRYILDPISEADMNNFLIRHQQSHNEINGVLGVAGNDLSSLNVKDVNNFESWLQLHFQEHFQWQRLTNVP
jgi:hypothetical protein